MQRQSAGLSMAGRAIEHFEEALRLDPGYAPAHSGLAESYALYGSHGWTVPGENAWTRAIAAAEKALELDELLAEGHTSRARIALNYELDWPRAETGYRRALELNRIGLPTSPPSLTTGLSDIAPSSRLGTARGTPSLIATSVIARLGNGESE
jgi:tetratricopeptide (TPR) repeat protein